MLSRNLAAAALALSALFVESASPKSEQRASAFDAANIAQSTDFKDVVFEPKTLSANGLQTMATQNYLSGVPYYVQALDSGWSWPTNGNIKNFDLQILDCASRIRF